MPASHLHVLLNRCQQRRLAIEGVKGKLRVWRLGKSEQRVGRKLPRARLGITRNIEGALAVAISHALQSTTGVTDVQEEVGLKPLKRSGLATGIGTGLFVLEGWRRNSMNQRVMRKS